MAAVILENSPYTSKSIIIHGYLYVYYSIIIFKYFSRQYRFIANRQLTGWCWGWLGRKVRVVLPSCSVTANRNNFPSEQYAGFILVIRPLGISHPNIIVKDQHLFINNKVHFCVCKYNNYYKI